MCLLRIGESMHVCRRICDLCACVWVCFYVGFGFAYVRVCAYMYIFALLFVLYSVEIRRRMYVCILVGAGFAYAYV